MIEVNNIHQLEEFLDKANIPYRYYITPYLCFILDVEPSDFSKMRTYLRTSANVGILISRSGLGINQYDISFIHKIYYCCRTTQNRDRDNINEGNIDIEYLIMKDYQEILNNDIRK